MTTIETIILAINTRRNHKIVKTLTVGPRTSDLPTLIMRHYAVMSDDQRHRVVNFLSHVHTAGSTVFARRRAGEAFNKLKDYMRAEG